MKELKLLTLTKHTNKKTQKTADYKMSSAKHNK